MSTKESETKSIQLDSETEVRNRKGTESGVGAPQIEVMFR